MRGIQFCFFVRSSLSPGLVFVFVNLCFSFINNGIKIENVTGYRFSLLGLYSVLVDSFVLSSSRAYTYNMAVCFT